MPAIKRLAKWPRRRPDPPGVTLPRTQRPKTPNAQAPNAHPTPRNEPLPIATPTRGVLRNHVQGRLAKYPAGRPRRRRPGIPNATPTAPGATLPRTQRQRPPNALAATQRPKMNPHGSLRLREGCFRRTNGGPSQSIPPEDLVVAAGRGIQRPPDESSHQAQAKSLAPGRPCRTARGAKIRACHSSLPSSSLPPPQASASNLPPRPGVTLPSPLSRK